jgi:hypothetical protein
MRKTTASGVLISLRGSTYGLGIRLFITGDGWAGENYLRFASSLAAALLKAFLNILRDYLALSVTSREFESPRIFFNS